MSISRSSGSGVISLAKPMSLSVTPLMAETTTTTWSPFARYWATRRATFWIRSVLPTEVPPNFCTIRAMAGSKNVVSGEKPAHTQRKKLTECANPATIACSRLSIRCEKIAENSPSSVLSEWTGVTQGVSVAKLQFRTRPSLHEGQLGVTVGDSLAPRLQEKSNWE